MTFYLIDQLACCSIGGGCVVFAGRTQGTLSQDRAEHHYSNCRVNICVISIKEVTLRARFSVLPDLCFEETLSCDCGLCTNLDWSLRANLVEETPERTLSTAVFITFIITMSRYLVVKTT